MVGTTGKAPKHEVAKQRHVGERERESSGPPGIPLEQRCLFKTQIMSIMVDVLNVALATLTGMISDARIEGCLYVQVLL